MLIDLIETTKQKPVHNMSSPNCHCRPCWHAKTKGHCAHGTNCKFAHPNETGKYFCKEHNTDVSDRPLDPKNLGTPTSSSSTQQEDKSIFLVDELYRMRCELERFQAEKAFLQHNLEESQKEVDRLRQYEIDLRKDNEFLRRNLTDSQNDVRRLIQNAQEQTQFSAIRRQRPASSEDNLRRRSPPPPRNYQNDRRQQNQYQRNYRDRPVRFSDSTRNQYRQRSRSPEQTFVFSQPARVENQAYLPTPSANNTFTTNDSPYYVL